MAEPDLVAECIDAMRNAVDIPVSVKHRIGIDDMHSYEEMLHFVDTVIKPVAITLLCMPGALLKVFHLKKP